MNPLISKSFFLPGELPENGLLDCLDPLFAIILAGADQLGSFLVGFQPVSVLLVLAAFLFLAIRAFFFKPDLEAGFLFLALILGGGSFALFSLRYPIPAWGLLLLAGVSGGRAASPPSPAPPRLDNRGRAPARVGFFLILTIFLAAAIYRLDSFPASTNAFEVRGGLSALQLINRVQPGIGEALWRYVDRTYFGSATAPFFVYPVAVLFRIIGPGLTAIRLTGVLGGALSLVFLYLMLGVLFDRRRALLAILLAAFLPWFFSLARLGTYSSQSLAYYLAILWLTTRGLKGRFGGFPAAGALFALITYFYLPVKTLIPLLPLLFLHSLVTEKRSRRRTLLGALGFLAAYAIVSFALGNPLWTRLLGVASQRTFVGSPLNQTGFNPLQAASDIHRKISMILYILFYRSHEIFFPYPNGPLIGRGVLLLAGLGWVWSLRRWKRRGNFLLAAGLVTVFLPALLVTPETNNQAIARRCFLALPYLAALTAVFLEALIDATTRIGPRVGPVAARSAVGLFLLSTTLLNLGRYFSAPPYPLGGSLWRWGEVVGDLVERGYRVELVHGYLGVGYNLREVADFAAWQKTGQVYSFYTWDTDKRTAEHARVKMLIPSPTCRHWPGNRFEEALQAVRREGSVLLIHLDLGYPYQGRSFPARIFSLDPLARVGSLIDQQGNTIGFQYIPE